MNLSSVGLLHDTRGLLIDLDGVIYTGALPIPGAGWFLQQARASGLHFLLVTNNSTTRPAQVAERLRSMGIAAEEDEILTSAQAAAAYVRSEGGEGCPVIVIGEAGLIAEARAAGLDVVLQSERARYVIAGLDRSFDYARLTLATGAILGGARLVATNVDSLLPIEGGAFLPGAGAIVGAIQAATGARPVVMGKPEPELFTRGMRLLGDLQAKDVTMIGDRMDTDIIGARRVGLRTVLVLTGVSTRQSISPGDEPTAVVPSIADVASLLGWQERFSA